jgi:hypothetical protein
MEQAQLRHKTQGSGAEEIIHLLAIINTDHRFVRSVVGVEMRGVRDRCISSQ